MALTITKEQAFWAQIGLAKNNPHLYKTWHDWMHFLGNSDWWMLRGGLVEYFGCSERIADLWIDWARAVSVKEEAVTVQEKLDAALKSTWQDDGGIPKRFEQYMEPEYWEGRNGDGCVA